MAPVRPSSIAIIGASCKFPGGVYDLNSYWRALIDKNSPCITPVPLSRWDNEVLYAEKNLAAGQMDVSKAGWIDNVDKFDNEFFGLSDEEAAYIRPAERLSLEQVWHALEDAGISASSLKGKRVAVIFASSGEDGYERIALVNRGIDAMDKVESHPHLAIAERIQSFLQVRGIATNVQTACSSTHVALHEAVDALELDKADLVIAGGATLHLWPGHFSFLSKGNMSSKQGRCAAFSADADGYAPSEGISFVVLKRMQDVKHDRVRGIIRASTIVHCGRSASLSAPSQEAQQRLFEINLQRAGLHPRDISHMEAHGTGTPAGDPVEIAAINNVYRGSHSNEDKLIVTSGKTMIGHTEEVSGLAGILKVLLSFEHGQIPPHLHFDRPRKDLDLSVIPMTIPANAIPYPGENKLAAVNSFGFAGTLAQIIVQEPPRRSHPADGTDIPSLLVMSARSPQALENIRKNYMDYLSADVDFANFCYTSQVGRVHQRFRHAVVASNATSAIKELAKIKPYSTASSVTFMFPGQGSQRVNMGRELYEHFTSFRETMDQCANAFERTMKFSLLDIMYPSMSKSNRESPSMSKSNRESPYSISDTVISQPALFSYSVAMARLFLSLGVSPNAVIGHSVGEIAAACISGALTIDAAMAFLCHRGRIMQPPESGRPAGMAAVIALEQDVRRALVYSGVKSVEIAAFNGDKNTVVSGYIDELEALGRYFAEKGTKFIKLSVKQAFHSPVIEPCLRDLREYVTAHEAEFGCPTVPFISTLTGMPITRKLDSNYWVSHARNPVRFLQASKELKGVCIDMGPDGVLASLVKDCSDIIPISCGNKNAKSDIAVMLSAIGATFATGINVNFAALPVSESARIVDIPLYPFEQRRFWLDGDDAIKQRLYEHVGQPESPQVEVPSFAGTYQLLAMNMLKITDPDDAEPIARLAGDNPQGLLTYTDQGFMSVYMSPQRPEVFKSLEYPTNPAMQIDEGDVGKWAKLGVATIAYCGRYEVDIPKSMVKHHVEISHLPAWANTIQERNFKFSDGGKVLTLTSETPAAGIKVNLVWKRRTP